MSVDEGKYAPSSMCEVGNLMAAYSEQAVGAEQMNLLGTLEQYCRQCLTICERTHGRPEGEIHHEGHSG